MKTIHKRLSLFGLFIFLFASCIFLFKSCIIQNPRPENCTEVKTTITKIEESVSYDIRFYGTTDNYYINRGLEQGLNLDSLNAKVLNKSVTLHLANVIGNTTTAHIVQLEVEGDTIYSEFPDYVKKQKHK